MSDAKPHRRHRPGRRKYQPIAVIGIGCRFPGGANTPAQFWDLLQAGTDAVTDASAERRALWTSWREETESVRWGGYLDGIDRFDAAFFGISPREARHIDPQQRLLLETAWEALEDAGQVPARLRGSATGVFIGIFLDEYWDLQRYASGGSGIDAHTNTGGTMSIAANRLSYWFDFHGPSLSVDTACSSSLVAVHLACQSIHAGECGLALAGGVNLLLTPHTTQGFERAAMLASDGRCKAFDARADGYVRGEGAGVVVLKPLDDAIADGDPIYAVIRGSAVNQDGRTLGMTVPDQNAQEAILREACRKARVRPGQIAFIEAHGTGTPTGDPVEAAAIGRVMGRGRAPDTPCLIGSVKTNIGHLEAASGIAGLIKTALALKFRRIPPNRHFQQPNPAIPFEKWRLRVVTDAVEWKDTGAPVVAGVNSFGFGGTNAHVVLETPPRLPEADAPPVREPVLLPLSARTEQTLRMSAQRYADHLETATHRLYDIAATAGARRAHHERRLAVVTEEARAAARQLRGYLSGETPPDVILSPSVRDTGHTLAFVYTGMGTQWRGMGRELFDREPAFRAAIEQCDDLFRPYTAWSLIDEMRADETRSRMTETRVAQIANFALQTALTALWRAWGIVPDYVVGHSVGEVAAAYAAGALRLDDAIRISFHRSRVQQQTAGQGAMLAVGLAPEEARAQLDAAGIKATVAAVNSPVSVALSGAPDMIRHAQSVFENAGVFCRRLRVDVPYHSPLMEPLEADFAQAIQGIRPRDASIPFVSTVTGGLVAGTGLDAAYWWRNIREPVDYAAVMDTLIARGCDVFLQIGPHPALSMAISENLAHHGASGAVLHTLKREAPERPAMLRALGELYVRGFEVDWPSVYRKPWRVASLPSYPWQKERFWLETPPSAPRLAPDASAPSGHPLLGRHTLSSIDGSTHFWEMAIDAGTLPALSEHRVRGRVVVPAAAYIEMAYAVARAALELDACRIEEVKMDTALLLEADTPRTVQVALTRESPDSAICRISSRVGDAPWTTHAACRVRRLDPADERAAALPDREDHPRDAGIITHEAHYRDMARRGLDYGERYRSVAGMRVKDPEVWSELKIPEAVLREQAAYHLHPAILDAVLQTLSAVWPAEPETFLPARIASILMFDTPLTPRLRVTGRVTNAGHHEGDAALLNENGAPVAIVRGVRFEPLDKKDRRRSVDAWLYEVRWVPGQAKTPAPAKTGKRWLIFADDAGLGERLAERLEAQGDACTRVYSDATYRRTAQTRFEINPETPSDYTRLILESIREPANKKISESGFHSALESFAHSPIRPFAYSNAFDECLYLWGVDAPLNRMPESARAQMARSGMAGLLRLTQALATAGWAHAPRLCVVTNRSACIDAPDGTVDPHQAMLAGLTRVIQTEHPELRCRLIDIDRDEAEAEDSLYRALTADDSEPETAYRGGERLIRRIVRYKPEEKTPHEAAPHPAQTPERSSGPPSVRAVIPHPGSIGRIVFEPLTRVSPGPEDVEIRVRAAGLNFRDVMTVSELLPPDNAGQDPVVGWECAGAVTAVGGKVDTLHTGDRVMAVAPPCFATYAVTKAALATPIPPGLSYEDAATIPIAFMTAYHALVHLGRLQPGDRVLIHAASGGVGLAAVQIAQTAGAEIFATAGSPEKREYLKQSGIRHVMDSRSLSFADEILARTGGRGVDVVLNALAGDAMRRSLDILAPYGRFLEIGKTDMLNHRPVDLGVFERNISYFAIDLAALCRERPGAAGRLLGEVADALALGALAPLPRRSYPLGALKQAVQYMAQARHIGKIVISVDDRALTGIRTPPALPITGEASYLIAGGTGALGLAVAQWLAEKGARHLALTARRKPSKKTQDAVERLKRSGVDILVIPGDVAQRSSAEKIIDRITASMPPLRGVIHAAGVLDDGLLLHQTPERFARVLAPKALGAWHLHHLTRERRLDFFVLFSSVASLIGTPGQGNYAAANAFLDALAHFRRARGLPAVSINWGPWAGDGMAAQASDHAGAVLFGMGRIPKETGLQALERALIENPAQIAVLPIAWSDDRWAHPLFEAVRPETQTDAASTPCLPCSTIRDAAPEEQKSLLTSYLIQTVSRIAELAPETIEPAQTWRSMGIDSLMAVEIKNRLEADLGLVAPVTDFQAEKPIEESVMALIAQLNTYRAPPGRPVLSKDEG